MEQPPWENQGKPTAEGPRQILAAELFPVEVLEPSMLADLAPTEAFVHAGVQQVLSTATSAEPVGEATNIGVSYVSITC